MPPAPDLILTGLFGHPMSVMVPAEVQIADKAYFRHFLCQEALYCEGEHILHVRIARIEFGRIAGASRCMQLDLEGLETPGLQFKDHIFLVANLEYFTGCYPSFWEMHCTRSYLYFRTKVINDVIAIVSKLPPGKTFHDDYTYAPIDPLPPGHGILGFMHPGKVVSAVQRYMRDAWVEELRLRHN